MDKPFELKITVPNEKKKTVEWRGSDGINAAQRYADAHPGTTVYAWREADSTGVLVGMPDGQF